MLKWLSRNWFTTLTAVVVILSMTVSEWFYIILFMMIYFDLAQRFKFPLYKFCRRLGFDALYLPEVSQNIRNKPFAYPFLINICFQKNQYVTLGWNKFNTLILEQMEERQKIVQQQIQKHVDFQRKIQTMSDDEILKLMQEEHERYEHERNKEQLKEYFPNYKELIKKK